MFKSVTLAATALAIAGSAVVPATPAAAQARYPRYDEQRYDRHSGQRYDRGYDDRRYYDRRANGYRARECKDGGGGAIIGAIAGGLLGNIVGGHGNRPLGTVLGAGGGALAGRAIDRSDRPGYCRR